MNGIPAIMKVVTNHFGIPLDRMTGTGRSAQLVRARHLAIMLCRQMTSASYPEIAAAFGRQDHTSVMRAFKSTEKRLKVDRNLRIIYLRLRDEARPFAETAKCNPDSQTAKR